MHQRYIFKLRDFDESFLAQTLFLTVHLLNVIKVLNLKFFQPEVEDVAQTNARETILFGVTKIEEALYNICFDLKNTK